MAGKLNVAREKLAIKILEDFRGKITGDYSPICIGENPENRYFVGKLLPVSEGQTSSFGSDVFIESIGMDFYVATEDIETAAIKVYPRGDFYYRAYPTFEQQRNAFLDEINDSEETPFADFDALIEAYNNDPSAFAKRKTVRTGVTVSGWATPHRCSGERVHVGPDPVWLSRSGCAGSRACPSRRSPTLLPVQCCMPLPVP